jgi:hypothetical protein
MKDFLPRSHSTMIPLDKPIKLPSKCGSCFKRAFPIVGLLTIMCGSAFIGFSIVTIGENQIGYFANDIACVGTDCAISYRGPGTYLELPWNKGNLNVIDVGAKNWTIGTVTGSIRSGKTFSARLTTVEYGVHDINAYLNAITKFSNFGKFFDNMIDDVRRIITHAISEQTVDELRARQTFNLSTIMYGLSFESFTYQAIDIE